MRYNEFKRKYNQIVDTFYDPANNHLTVKELREKLQVELGYMTVAQLYAISTLNFDIYKQLTQARLNRENKGVE